MGGAVCLTAGCGKPTWNGKPNDYCGRACRAAGAGAAPAGGASTVCLVPGCGKPTWNGKTNEYCGRACRTAAAAAGPVPAAAPAAAVPAAVPAAGPGICLIPGCGKPTWSGKANDFCSRACKSTGDKTGVANLPGTAAAAVPQPAVLPAAGGMAGGGAAAGAAGVPASGAAVAGAPAAGAPSALCLAPGCGKPSWNGQPNEYCGKACKVASCGKPVFGTHVDKAKFDELVAQFNSKWKDPGQPPKIKSIWNVNADAIQKQHEQYCDSIGNVPIKGHGQNPGNQQRRFHATKLGCRFAGKPCKDSQCFVCSIIKTGFKSSKAGTSAGTRFGAGIYCSSTSSKAYSYGKQAMFIVGVACGIGDMAGSSGPLPPGTHSRIVNNSDDETVVFEDAAMVPKYLILFA